MKRMAIPAQLQQVSRTSTESSSVGTTSTHRPILKAETVEKIFEILEAKYPGRFLRFHHNPEAEAIKWRCILAHFEPAHIKQVVLSWPPSRYGSNGPSVHDICQVIVGRWPGFYAKRLVGERR